jgi:hypothetical protein
VAAQKDAAREPNRDRSPVLGDSLWAFKIGGALKQATPPAPIPARTPVIGPSVAGSAVADAVVLGRTKPGDYF